MKDIRRYPFRPAPGLVPQELLSKVFECTSCKANVKVPWLEKMEFPQQPFQPVGKDGHWVPVSIPLECHVCKTKMDARIPIIEKESRWSLYGDEAGRYIANPLIKYSTEPLNFFCITLVGLHQTKQVRVKRKIQSLKRKICPDRDPESWSHHFTKIWSSKSGSGDFLLKNKEEKISHAKKFAKIIAQSRHEMVTFNISGCLRMPNDKRDRASHLKYQKEEIFAQSILMTLMLMRDQNKSVEWVFDNVKDTTNGQRTEGWAEECFLGLQYTRLFTWLSSGSTTVKPVFTKPGSHYLLEVADFVSYVVAREFERNICGKPVEIPSSLLGNGIYQGAIANGDVKYRWSVGLPLKEFYGI